MDTTSLSFYGEGGQTLGEHGYSKDYRPDLEQMILGLVVEAEIGNNGLAHGAFDPLFSTI
jgi:transposase